MKTFGPDIEAANPSAAERAALAPIEWAESDLGATMIRLPAGRGKGN